MVVATGPQSQHPPTRFIPDLYSRMCGDRRPLHSRTAETALERIGADWSPLEVQSTCVRASKSCSKQQFNREERSGFRGVPASGGEVGHQVNFHLIYRSSFELQTRD
jgi:hypothetical protein